MESHLLEELVTLFTVSIGVLVICHRLRIPGVVGLLLTGMICGPYGFSFVSSQEEIEVLAEIGVVLLLFTIGAEFSLQNLLQIRRLMIVGGLVQVGLTLAATIPLAMWLGLRTGEAILVGFLTALSSTALVLKLLQDRADIDSLYGRNAFAILIFQDLVIVPVILLVPFMADDAVGGVPIAAVAWTLLKGGLIVGAVLLLASRIVPRTLHVVVSMRSPELFLLTVVVICFAVAFITQKVGLSLALGALLAGLIISESEYSHHALGNILPFQQVFTTLFFVSVGMLLDVRFAFEHWSLIVTLATGVIVLKALCAFPSAIALGFPLEAGILSGLALAQVGEFSFVLAKSGLQFNVISLAVYQTVLSVSILTIGLTPLVMTHAPRFARLINGLPLPARLIRGRLELKSSEHLMSHEELSDHTIIVGLGLSGRMAARALEHAGIRYVGIDVDPERVQAARKAGKLVVFGDATQDAILKEEGVQRARVVIAAVSNAAAVRQIVFSVRQLNPRCYLIVRTKLPEEIEDLYKLGANEVVAEDFEAGIEIVSRLLRRYTVPRNEIEEYLVEVRGKDFTSTRRPLTDSPELSSLIFNLPNVEILTYRISANSQHVGTTLGEAAFRRRFGVTLLAVKRDEEVLVNPDASTRLKQDDVIFLLGPPSDLESLERSF